MTSPERNRTLSLAEALNEHRYPHLLHAWPPALRLYHAAVHLTTLRSWYVRRRLRLLSDELAARAAVVDAGCGTGDHLFYVLRRRPDVVGIGIDRAEENVRLCRTYAAGLGATETDFRRQDFDADASIPPNDLTLCIGMLQYVERDGRLLRAIRDALSATGRLLLYVPVRNERILPLFRRCIPGRATDYDAAQGLRHAYHPKQVRAMLDECELEIVTEEFTYGSCGKVAFELHALVLHGLTRGGAIGKTAAALGGVVALPALLGLMTADYLFPVFRGNGMLVVAHPRPD